MLWFLTLLLPSAWAITEPRSGPYLDLAGGLAVDGPPWGAGPGWQVGGGVWFGPYDDEYALGRFTSVGLALRQEWVRGALVTSPQLELRRGLDLFVVKPWLFLSGGPEIRDGALGGQVRVGGAAKYRFHRHFGLTARLEAGGAWTGAPELRAGLVIGLEWARPFRGEAPR